MQPDAEQLNALARRVLVEIERLPLKVTRAIGSALEVAAEDHMDPLARFGSSLKWWEAGCDESPLELIRMRALLKILCLPASDPLLERLAHADAQPWTSLVAAVVEMRSASTNAA